MIKIFNKIKNIVIGNWRRFSGNQLTEEGQRRFNICMECDHKIQIAKTEYICKECGCPIKSKCQVLDEKCLLNKW